MQPAGQDGHNKKMKNKKKKKKGVKQKKLQARSRGEI